MATRSPTEHHPHWGTYGSTANLPNVAGSPTQNGALEAGDIAFVSGAGLYVCDSATLGAAVWSAAGGGGGSQVIWKWNETDVSQFQFGIEEAGGGGAGLSVVTRTWGPVLRVTFPTKVSGLQLTVITFADLMLSKDANDRYLYEFIMRFAGTNAVQSEWYAGGPAWLCNRLTGASFYGLGMMAMIGSATRSWKVEAGTKTLSGGTPNWKDFWQNNGQLSRFNLDAMTRHVAGNAPGFKNTLVLDSMDNNGYTIPSFPMDDAYFISQLGAFGAGWNTETLDTLGIGILGATGTTANQYFEFDELVVMKHPIDR